ncbi:hypothetical protein I5535_01090 [Rhodobacteraceae bacterium F11138]|nr:hypothetical protein [Rhodobacteraceae bacterium F11138]
MRIVLTVVLAITASALYAVDPQAVRQCAAIKNAKVRLACYDAAAAEGKPKRQPTLEQLQPKLSQPDRSGK